MTDENGKKIYETTPPCYKCERRHVGCHADCKEYKAFKSQLEEANRIRKQAKQLDSIGIVPKRRRERHV